MFLVDSDYYRNPYFCSNTAQYMQFTYYGHSCFLIDIKGTKLLFDPFISGNELANKVIDVNSIQADYILVSHGHADHTIDLVPVAGRTGAEVICSWEIYEWLGKQNITKVHPMNTGGKWNFGPFTVKCVSAQHSSGLPDGSYGGNPMGFIVTSEEGNFYYSGDTALTMDMQLIPHWAALKFAILPIGDNFTMDVADAVQCAGMVKCNQIIGVHYDTFGYIKIDHAAAKKAFAASGSMLHLLDIGETINL
jgi:L-ascorbate metabolism protein UlaG (beta-lactamase superfamily)